MGGFINKSKPNGWNLGFDAANEERLFGAGLTNDQIDYQSIIAFSKWCDNKNLKFDAVVDSQRPCSDIMIDIASAGRGSPTWSNGKLGVVWADPADIPVAMFGMGNIIAGSFEVGYNIERKTDEFVASYNDKDDFYISRQVRATVPGVTQPVNTTSLQLYGITSQEQAQREVNLRAADSRYHIRTISFSTSLEGMVPQRGDVVLLAHDLTAWAHSGRLSDINGATITLPKKIDADGWIQIRLPDGTYYAQQVSAGETNVITLAQALPIFEDHFPEDFIFQIGPLETAGKKCRVLSVEPSGNATVKITCTDDYPEYYAQENTPSNNPTDKDEHLTAKVYNAVVERRVDGNWLCWELENARGAQVSATVLNAGSSTISGNLVIPGLELKLPNHPTGTVLQIALIPNDVVQAEASFGDQLTFTY
jgi:predicted phage tail protein